MQLLPTPDAPNAITLISPYFFGIFLYIYLYIYYISYYNFDILVIYLFNIFFIFNF
jgi:hypothetical protein